MMDKPTSLDKILEFLKRLYDWGKCGRSYNTQDSTKSTLDCLVDIVQHNIEMQKEIKELRKRVRELEKKNETE